MSNSAPATVSINILGRAAPGFLYLEELREQQLERGGQLDIRLRPAATGQPYYTLNFTPFRHLHRENDLNSGFVLNQLNVAGTVTFAGPNSPAFTANGPMPAADQSEQRQ